MKTTNQRAFGVAAAIAVAVGACNGGTPAPPPAPAVPGGWTVKTDAAIPSAAFAPVEAKLGGKLAALRNTVYDAHGKTVQINTMKAATPADEDNLIKGITAMKPAWSFIKKGDVVYELVGENDATAEMKAEHDLLAK